MQQRMWEIFEMKNGVKTAKRSNVGRGGFTLIELMISLLIVSFLGLSYTYVMKKNQTAIRSSDNESSLSTELSLVRKTLEADLRQVAMVYPSCTGNPGTPATTTLCTSIKVASGYMPLPGMELTDVSALSNFSVPAHYNATTSSLTKSSDALRIVVYNLSGAFNCRLNGYRSPNPSTTALERLWPLRQGCTGNLAVGGLYVAAEDMGTRVFSEIFQITALSDLGGVATSVDQLQVDANSASNNFNPVGGLGNSGFSNAARIFPVKMIEWAYQTGQGLFRRDIIPSQTNMTGYGTWRLISSSIEGIQFFPVTITATGAVQHNRTMQLTGDTANNGVEDIRGVNVRYVVKSSKANADDVTYDNPITAAAENDHYPRQEALFYVDFPNTRPDS